MCPAADNLASAEPAEEGGRAHRRLGADLDLFHFEEAAPGMAFWHGSGMAVWNALSALWRECNEEMDYEEVRSPLLYDAELWKRSGHWDKYRDLMFHFEIDEEEMGLKPMNCPGHCLIYSHRPRSYRELPLRLSEQGHVHRYEMSGNVNGLLRARSFVIDDAHLFCRDSQVEAEVRACLVLARRIYALFGFALKAELSLRPADRIGDSLLWDRAEGDLRRALEAEEVAYEERPGEGAFYGPKVDIHLEDALGRDWQLGSVQLDYQLPIRFDLRYIAEDGQDHELVDGEERPYRPVMVHRAMFGSMERFIAVLLEHFDGQLPLWCAPNPVVVIPRGDEDVAYAADLLAELKRAGVRGSLNGPGESLGKRVRSAEVARVPVMLVIGPREREAGEVNVRRRGGAQESLSRADAVALLAAAWHERRLEV
jgi:threonyl-tRNA synthetase